jgi:hypothetical protein
MTPSFLAPVRFEKIAEPSQAWIYRVGWSMIQTAGLGMPSSAERRA